LIAVDSSSLIAYLAGDSGPDIQLVSSAIDNRELRLPPPVVTELFSRPHARQAIDYILQTVAVLPMDEGVWERAGRARQVLLRNRRKAALADALIAQACIDLGIALISRDSDFRHFERYCGLKLAV
jgi:predicted nucleic acid-binding protein